MDDKQELDQLIEKLKKKLDFSKAVHTNPIEIGQGLLEDIIIYLEQLRDRD